MPIGDNEVVVVQVVDLADLVDLVPMGDTAGGVPVVDVGAGVATKIRVEVGGVIDGVDATAVAVAVVVGSHNTGDVSDRDAVAAAVVEEEEEICLVGDLLHETVCPFHGVVAEVVVVEEVIAHWMLWSTTTLSEAIGSLLKKVQGNN